MTDHKSQDRGRTLTKKDFFFFLLLSFGNTFVFFRICRFACSNSTQLDSIAMLLLSSSLIVITAAIIASSFGKDKDIVGQSFKIQLEQQLQNNSAQRPKTTYNTVRSWSACLPALLVESTFISFQFSLGPAIFLSISTFDLYNSSKQLSPPNWTGLDWSSWVVVVVTNFLAIKDYRHVIKLLMIITTGWI